LDLPGFGSSPMPPWQISIPDYGRLLGGFREALGLDACTLVGNSMGGFIAAEVAVGEPEWVERLVLVSSAGISHARMRRGPVLAGARVSVLVNPLLRRLDIAAMRRPGLRGLLMGGVIRHPEWMPREMLVEFIAPALGAPGFVPAVAALTGYDLLDRLARIRMPTLVVWGRDDLVVPAADAAGFIERIPGARLVVFDDCGHLPMAERPVRFNRLLAGFCGARAS
ncbi:MAG: alpha/beta fold hydrolase, partial [Thermoleophilia bacterium]|nr:alpha/beta fold hydrolase [Thermoleophilia bacterium]